MLVCFMLQRWLYVLGLWVTILMKAIAQYFYVGYPLFIIQYKVVLTFKSVDETPECVWPFKWKLLRSTFLWYYLLCRTRWL